MEARPYVETDHAGVVSVIRPTQRQEFPARYATRTGAVLVVLFQCVCCAVSRGPSADADDPAHSVGAGNDAGAPAVRDDGSQATDDAGAGGANADAASRDVSAQGDTPVRNPWPGDVPDICDGSPSIRIRGATFGSAERTELGLHPIVQNGFGYWLITGKCHFYVMHDAAREIREGDLTPAQAQQLGQRVYDVGGGARDPAVTYAVGVDRVLIGLGGMTMSCQGACLTNWLELFNGLYDGEFAPVASLDGPMRVSVLIDSRGAKTPTAIARLDSWPLATLAPEDIALDFVTNPNLTLEELDGYKGAVLVDSSDTAALRDLRRRGLNGEFPYWEINAFFCIDSDIDGTNVRYELRFQDIIPLEDADGMIQETW